MNVFLLIVCRAESVREPKRFSQTRGFSSCPFLIRFRHCMWKPSAIDEQQFESDCADHGY
jgi:hypothetical protein